MIFWVCVIMIIVGIVLAAHFDGALGKAGGVTSFISGVVSIVMLISIACSYIGVDGNLEVNRERYDALTYKMESTTCRDEFGFLSKEVIDEVQDWNEDVRRYQSIQDDFWIGIFYPNVYDEFKTIDYNSYNKE